MAVAYQPNQQNTVNFGWISESWQLFMAGIGVWALATIIYVVVTLTVRYVLETILGMSTSVMTAMTTGTGPVYSRYLSIFLIPQYWIVIAAGLLTRAFFVAGFLKIANAQIRGQQIDIGMFFQGYPNFFPTLVV